MKSRYDFIGLRAGSSGSVVARRLAENPDVSVLLIEAGGDDDVATITDARRWFENVGTERDWQFVAQPNEHLRGRAIPLTMGKVLGGGVTAAIARHDAMLVSGIVSTGACDVVEER